MTSPLDNLLKVSKGGLKQEAPSQSEFDGLVRSAKRKRKDAAIPGLGDESRFDLTYNAAHALALAALRWHGYRSENRVLVFQALARTVGFSPPNGGCWIAATPNGIWRNTKATSMSTSSCCANWTRSPASSKRRSMRSGRSSRPPDCRFAYVFCAQVSLPRYRDCRR